MPLPKQNILDITDYKLSLVFSNEEAKRDLYRYIFQSVLDMQGLVLRPLPDVLLVTPYQFDILKPTVDTKPEDGMMYKNINPRTLEIVNVMEVHVKGVYEPKPNMLLLS